METCLMELFQNHFRGLMQLVNIFQHVQCRWNNYVRNNFSGWNNLISVSDVITCETKHEWEFWNYFIRVSFHMWPRSVELRVRTNVVEKLCVLEARQRARCFVGARALNDTDSDWNNDVTAKALSDVMTHFARTSVSYWMHRTIAFTSVPKLQMTSENIN